MKIRYTSLFIVFSFILANNLFAKHIIGGVMSYDCLGNNIYKITLKVYRDCAGGGADFDSPARIGVYRCGNSVNCANLDQFDAILTPDPNALDKSDINPPYYACLKVPPTVCVQEAIYQFNVTLSLSTESYFVVYQRCCRNNTISNIVDPEGTGATFMVEITPEAQQLCNSSPEFKYFPPTLICANEPLDFDHSAFDKDGDQLVYSLCSPLVGGGMGGGGGGCNSVVPDPGCPPPYDNVQFILPTYSFDKPLGQSSNINIDPFTGKLTVNPNLLGQFVVGVCVSEYRNGVLLSTIKRDFQFNVANCEPNVVADIKKDLILGANNFVINTCAVKKIDFINKSGPKSEINSYDWFFADGVPMHTNTADATVVFPGPGIFKGIMILNGGSTCADTSNIIVNIFPEIHAGFEYDYDTCRAEPVQFVDKSIADAGKVKTWFWDFGDKDLSNKSNPNNGYKKPGTYSVKLRVVDFNGCADSISKVVKYYPVPPLINIQPSSFIGCVPATVSFTNLSSPIDKNYQVNWDFGDGATENKISPVHTYDSAGVYTVSLEIVSPIGCKTSETFNSYITIEPRPIADFIFTPNDPSNLEPQVEFKDKSSGASAWGWSFGDGVRSIIQNPLHVYADTGMFVVTQYITHKSGCVDSLSKVIDVKPIIKYFMPNAFSPNGDGVNDEFKGAGIFLGLIDFDMIIWNRWGQVVFETNDPNNGWDGRINNAGNFVEPGVYICSVKYTGERNKHFEFKGYATVVR